MTYISIFLILAMIPPVFYLLVLAVASTRSPAQPPGKNYIPTQRFFILIPAHNEVAVIGTTIKQILLSDYPRQLFSIHVIADHCSDGTAQAACAAGAFAHERNEGPRTGKGAAIAWLLQKKITQEEKSDAVIVFDADTLVDPQFLRIMSARLAQGAQIIQGQHVISNPAQGWFPALTWVMFLIDNRFQNLGRSNLGWSAKNMGDSLCIRANILETLGWGEGLTEDYQLRMRLIMAGIRIQYEPFAKGFGEAPPTWGKAANQRSRWLRGTNLTNNQFGWSLMVSGLKELNWLKLDGAMQALFPPYSTLVIFFALILIFDVFSEFILLHDIPAPVEWSWGALTAFLFLYPFLGLLLEKAPLRAYLILITGPAFILWRTFLSIKSKFGANRDAWIRTEHGSKR